MNQKTLQRIDLVNNLLQKYGTMTVRQIYYQLVTRGLNYRQVQHVCQKGRERGLIPLEVIVDRSRQSYGLEKWENLDDALCSLEHFFKLDYWIDQLFKPEIWTEKDALSQILYEEADAFRVPVRITRGFLSTSKRCEWSNRNLLILYFGDHDPSGLYMDTDLKNSQFMDFASFERVALTKELVLEHNLPSVSVKSKDPRAKKYIEEYGVKGWELDALPPDYLRLLVRKTIEPLIEFDLEQKQAQERKIRERISNIQAKETSL